MTDPGFPIGGADPLGGTLTSNIGTFQGKMYAKMKELGPVVGPCTGHGPLDPPMQMQYISIYNSSLWR